MKTAPFILHPGSVRSSSSGSSNRDSTDFNLFQRISKQFKPKKYCPTPVTTALITISPSPNPQLATCNLQPARCSPVQPPSEPATCDLQPATCPPRRLKGKIASQLKIKNSELRIMQSCVYPGMAIALTYGWAHHRIAASSSWDVPLQLCSDGSADPS